MLHNQIVVERLVFRGRFGVRSFSFSNLLKWFVNFLVFSVWRITYAEEILLVQSSHFIILSMHRDSVCPDVRKTPNTELFMSESFVAGKSSLK